MGSADETPAKQMFADEHVTKATIKWLAFTFGEKEIQRCLLCVRSMVSEMRIF